MLERTVRLNSLYDFYHLLLTKKQREYMQMYYFDDLSLAEISEVANVSRQAVYDTLKRTENILESYEEQLSLFAKYNERIKVINQLEAKVGADDRLHQLLIKLKELS